MHHLSTLYRNYYLPILPQYLFGQKDQRMLNMLLRRIGLTAMIVCGLSSGLMAQTHFTFTSSTGNSMSIMVPTSIAPTVNGVALSAGDEIGVFTPAGLCVGAKLWTGASNISITVWGDNTETPAIEGAAAGEALSFRVWDSSAVKEGNASVTWQPVGGEFTGATTYQINTVAGLASFAGTVAPEPPLHFSYTSLTGSSMSILVQKSITPTVNGVELSAGDVIGVFTQTGLCVGAKRWNGVSNIAIPVWGDNDQVAGINGAVSGDSLSFRVWDSSAAKEGNAIVTWLPVGAGQFSQAYTYETNSDAGLASLSALVSPFAPVLSIPANASQGISTTPVLSWVSSNYADTYRVQVSTSTAFTTTILDDSTITTLTKAITTALKYNKNYYWRVNAKNSAGTSSWSSVSSFTTMLTSPALTTPANNEISVPVSTTLTWETVSGATAYHVQVSLSSDYSSPIVDDSSLTTGSKSLTALSNNTVYFWRVSAKNSGGSGSWSQASFTTIIAAPSAMSYSANPAMYWRAILIPGNNVSITGVVDSFTISPTLPAGLAINKLTGKIFGTPAGIQSAQSYSVTAWNAGGSTSVSISITINPPPTALNYAHNPVTYSKNFLITPNAATVTGIVDSFTVIPALPDGLILNKTLGTITGTPVSAQSASTYNITAWNPAGTISTSLSITINDAPTGLSYQVNAAKYWKDVTITSNAASVNGTIDSFTITPELPGGLSFNKTTGLISGTPGVTSSENVYVVTAWNSAGTDTSMISIMVKGLPASVTQNSPANNATGVSVTPALHWSAGVGYESYKYLVKMSTSSDLSLPVFNDSTLDTSTVIYIKSALEKGTKYYWGVAGKNPAGSGIWSLDSFTTIKSFTLAVTAPINGTITKNPDNTAYDSNTVVELTATPATGYTFTGWTGAATGTTNPVSITMNAAKTIAATFAIKTYELSVSATNGTVARNPDQTSYDSNSIVELTATPATGYTFTGWTGDASGSTNPLSVTMNGTKSVTATFAIKTYALTVNAIHGGVAKNPDLTSYDSNSVVELTATPATGYTFTGWTGDASGTTNPISVTMNGAKSVTANFAIKTYALSVTTPINGSITKNPDQPAYDSNTVVEVTATPATGYTFTGWTGAATGTTNPVSITMDAAKTIAATFAIKTYALSVSATNGTVARNPDQTSYDSNSVVELTATPATGYTFTGWTGDASGTTNPISVTMSGSKNVTANFAIKTYALTVTAPTNGTITKNPDITAYDSNTVVEVTATPATGYTFTGWTGDATGTTNPVSITMDAAKTIAATFVIKTYALSVSATNGTVARNPDQTSYDSNSVVELTATPATGYTFTGWTGDASGTTNPISVTMNGSKSVTATFAIKTYALTVTAPTNGTITKNPDQPAYDSNTVVEVTATPATGYTFTGWTGAVSGTTNPISVTMNGAKSVTANFAIKTYALSVTTPINGSITKNPDLTSYDSNAVVQLTATPATGYTFTGWTGDASGTTNPISVTMSGSKNVTATFAIKTYALTVTAPINGTIIKNPDQPAYDSNTVVEVTATPATGYTFTGWTGDASGTTNPISVTMNGAKSVTATFAIKTYALTVTAPINGTITKNPDITAYDSNTVVEVTATPATGYTFTGWTGDATGTTNPVSITMDAAKTIAATFVIKTYALTVSATNGTVARNPDQTSYDSNSVVELTATPATGYTFTGWTGDASGTTNPISVTMNGSKSVTATFAIKTYALTVTAPTNGTITKNPDNTAYDSNTVVEVTATPATGYTFTGWTGAATGTTNPVSITMNAAKTIAATFAIKTYELSVSATNGTVARNPDQTSYDSNSVVELTATPATGYTFTGWTGDASGTTNPISVTMSGSKNITATFAIKTYALTVTAPINGTIIKNPDQTAYDSNTVVEVTATPATGYTFTGWTGAATGTTNPVSITMDAAKTIAATFAIKTYALSVSATNGSVAKKPDLTSYDSNAVVQLTATPATGYTFTGWTGDASGTTNPISVTMNGAKSVTATFAIKTYALTVTALHGTVVKTPDYETYDSNTVVGLKVTPSAGYIFIGWTGAVTSASDSISITMNAALSVTANFEATVHNFALTSGWNIISLNIVPQDSGIASIFSSVSHLVIVKSNSGGIYWPAYGINTINTVSLGQGYQVYTTAADTLRVNGILVDVASTGIQLSSGWNMLAYMPNADMPITTALAGIASQIAIVKDNVGGIFWPEYGINTIGSMVVGQGYFIYMKSIASLTYPTGLGKINTIVSSGNYLPKAKHFVYSQSSTGSNASILLSRVVENTTLIADSSEIGAYDASGTLVGSGVVIGGKAAFTVWGDNTMTKEKDGLTSSEPILFKVWTPKGEEYSGTYVGTSGTGYSENAIMLGSLSIHRSLTITRCALASAYPNPFRGNVRIGFDVSSINGKDMQNVEINVYDVRGSIVKQIVRGLYKTGRYTVQWDGSEQVGSNMYIVMMKTDNFSQKMKLFKVK